MSPLLAFLAGTANAQSCAVVDGGDDGLDRALAAALDGHLGCGEVVRLPVASADCAWNEACSAGLVAERRLALLVSGRREAVADEAWIRLSVVDRGGARVLPASIQAGLEPVVDQLVASLEPIDVERARQGEELDALAPVPTAGPRTSAPEATASGEASRGALRLDLGWSQWFDPGFDGRLSVAGHAGAAAAVEVAVGSRFARVLPPDGPGAVEVVMPELDLGLLFDPPSRGSVHPWGGIALGACWSGPGAGTVAPSGRIEAGLDWVPGHVGLAVEAFAGGALAPGGATFDPQRRALAPLAGLRAGPAVRW